MIDERFTIKPQDDYWAVVDNYNNDKVCIINGIHTEIEAIWLCDFMNEQQSIIEAKDSLLSVLSKENEQLRQQLKEKEEDERLYANEILELRETNKEHIKFKSLGGNY